MSGGNSSKESLTLRPENPAGEEADVSDEEADLSAEETDLSAEHSDASLELQGKEELAKIAENERTVQCAAVFTKGIQISPDLPEANLSSAAATSSASGNLEDDPLNFHLN